MLRQAGAGVCLVERNVAQRIVALHDDIVEARVAHGVPGDDIVAALGPDAVLAVARGVCIAGIAIGALQEDLIALGLIEGNRSPPSRSNCDRNREVMQVRSGAGESVGDV
jgi:hypothetical protein